MTEDQGAQTRIKHALISACPQQQLKTEARFLLLSSESLALQDYNNIVLDDVLANVPWI